LNIQGKQARKRILKTAVALPLFASKQNRLSLWCCEQVTARVSPPRLPAAGRQSLGLLLLVGLSFLAFTSNAAVKTAKKPVINEYHGVKAQDDYQ